MFAAIVLNSGLSVRMGFPKQLLRFDDKHTFIETILEKYQDAGITLLRCVVNKDFPITISDNDLLQKLNVEFVINEHYNLGRSYSALLGLKSIPPDCNCFISNIDNPFIYPGLLKQMMHVLLPETFVVPCFEGKGGHPILLSKEIVNALIKQDNYQLSLKELLKDFKRINLNCEDDSIHVNINTPEEYRKYFYVND